MIVPYHFVNGVQEPEGWQSAIEEFEEKTCIRFVPRPPSRRDEVGVYTNGRGCGAKVGRFSDEVTPVILSKKGCGRKGN